MCGFAGILGPTGTIDRSTLETMARSLAHRGPDDEGIEIVRCGRNGDMSIGLAHRRLSIIDLTDAAHQPMEDKETCNWIVYNGEIYNYRELRGELKGRGCTFRSHSDTETILKAYSVYGVDCLDKLRGMFAFALWDQEQQKLFFAVDRFGIKPLYFHPTADGQLIFASELRTILKSGVVARSIEPLAVDSYLAYGAVQAPLTMIKNVYAVLPAQYMLYSIADRKMQLFNYWVPSRSDDGEFKRNPKRVNTKMREILQESVEKHLISDVPVGLFLSGGIDSSATVILANELKKGQLRTFSVSFSESSFSEAKYSRLVAERFCRNHTEICLSAEDLLSFLPQAIKSMDQPTIDGINVYAISKAVRETGIKVVLSGQGGDEIFGGYSTFKRIPLMLWARRLLGLVPRQLRGRMASKVNTLLNRTEISSKYSQILVSETDVLSQYLILRQLFGPTARKYLSGRSYNQEVLNGVPTNVVDALNDQMAELDIFSSISLIELRLYLANMLLRDGDFMSMAHGLEVRVPLLDHNIAEFVFCAHPRDKIGGRSPKPLLVNAMSDLLPREIYSRPKMGFTFPWEIWLRDQLRSEVEGIINEFPEENEMQLNVANCRTMWQMFLANAPGISWSRVWGIYVLLKWYREHICN